MYVRNTTSRQGLLEYLEGRRVTRDSGFDTVATEAAEYYWRHFRFDGAHEHGTDSDVADWCRKAGARFAQGWAQ